MKKSWPGGKANESEVETQAEAKEPPEKSYGSRILKMKKNIVTMRRVEAPRKDSMAEEVLFPEVEEEEEPKEA
jgi:hypothetical protein